VVKVAFGIPLTLGAGYDNLTWAFDPRRAVALVLLLFLFRAVATVATVAGGGVGGLFIPLVVEGALLGRAVGGLFRTAASGSHFFPLVGVSAFLGAGYRVPNSKYNEIEKRTTSVRIPIAARAGRDASSRLEASITMDDASPT